MCDVIVYDQDGNAICEDTGEVVEISQEERYPLPRDPEKISVQWINPLYYNNGIGIEPEKLSKKELTLRRLLGEYRRKYNLPPNLVQEALNLGMKVIRRGYITDYDDFIKSVIAEAGKRLGITVPFQGSWKFVRLIHEVANVKYKDTGKQLIAQYISSISKEITLPPMTLYYSSLVYDKVEKSGRKRSGLAVASIYISATILSPKRIPQSKISQLTGIKESAMRNAIHYIIRQLGPIEFRCAVCNSLIDDYHSKDEYKKRKEESSKWKVFYGVPSLSEIKSIYHRCGTCGSESFKAVLRKANVVLSLDKN